MKKIILLLLLLLSPLMIKAGTLSTALKGKILLQVEENGEAWYVNPADEERYYMGRPDDAYNLMRELGIGITNENLNKIPIAEANFGGTDTDSDGLSDAIEDSIGSNKFKADSDDDGYNDKTEILLNSNPNGLGKFNIDLNFANSQKGKIFIQVEAHGEAWYIYPDNSKRYFLSRPIDAFNIMRSLGLGITTANLEQIVLSTRDSIVQFSNLELLIHQLINKERTNVGLNALKWSEDIANVSRRHSQDLAKENIEITNPNTYCNYPIIHHEGYTFGYYQNDRLANSGLYYYSSDAENIALIPSLKEQSYTYSSNEPNPAHDCQNDIIENNFRTTLDSEPDINKKIEIIFDEIAFRKQLMLKEKEITFSQITKYTDQELAEKTVQGWMNSPGHKKNILTPSYDEAGIGVAKINNYVISTQVFIDRTDCGFKNGACCIKEGYYPFCFTPLSCSNNICIQ